MHDHTGAKLTQRDTQVLNRCQMDTVKETLKLYPYTRYLKLQSYDITVVLTKTLQTWKHTKD